MLEDEVSDQQSQWDFANLSYNQLRRVIGRATELDHGRSETLSEEDVRAIARELEVSEASVDKALAEAPFAPLLTNSRFAVASRTSAIGMALGLLSGVLVGMAPHVHYFALLGACVAFGGASLFALLARGEAKYYKYNLKNAWLWIGFGLGVPSASGSFHFPAILDVTLRSGAFCAVAGSTFLWLRHTLKSRKGPRRRLARLETVPGRRP